MLQGTPRRELRKLGSLFICLIRAVCATPAASVFSCGLEVGKYYLLSGRLQSAAAYLVFVSLPIYKPLTKENGMNIVEKKISEIKPYERNPRRNDEAVKYLVESISNFGFKQPIVVDKDGVIVAGHTRLKAAKQLGMPAVPCVVADDLTPEQIKAFRLADNKVAEMAGWDFALLEEELQLIDIDMEAFGFTDYEEVDIGDFFEDAEQKKKEPKKIQCPHCGEWFEK